MIFDDKNILYSVIATKKGAIIYYTVNGKTMQTKECELKEVPECIKYITDEVIPTLLKI